MSAGKHQHRQVWVKVNAPVDAGIAPVVAALSEIDGVCTAASCEGYSSVDEEPQANVIFTFARSDPALANSALQGPPRKEPAEFAIWFGRELRRLVQDDAELSVSYSHNPPLLNLAVRRTAVTGVAGMIRRLAK